MSTFIRDSGRYKPYDMQHRFRRRLLFILKFIILVSVFYLFIRAFLIDSYYVRSHSMEPAVGMSERVLATPVEYGPYLPFSTHRFYTVNEPERGDIVVYLPPEARPEKVIFKVVDPVVRFFTLNRVHSLSVSRRHHSPGYMVKRIIGMPGDEIELRENGVYIKAEGSAYFLHEGEVITHEYKLIEDLSLYTTPYIRKHFTLGDDEFFLLGDNRASSLDSIDFGPVKGADIYGQVILRYFPFKRFGRP